MTQKKVVSSRSLHHNRCPMHRYFKMECYGMDRRWLIGLMLPWIRVLQNLAKPRRHQLRNWAMCQDPAVILNHLNPHLQSTRAEMKLISQKQVSVKNIIKYNIDSWMSYVYVYLTSNTRYFKLLQTTVKESLEKTVSLDTIAQQKDTTARIQKDTTAIVGWITLSNRYSSAHPEATEIQVQQQPLLRLGHYNKPKLLLAISPTRKERQRELEMSSDNILKKDLEWQAFAVPI